MFHLLRRFFPMQRHHRQWRGIRHSQKHSVRAPLGAASAANSNARDPRVPSEVNKSPYDLQWLRLATRVCSPLVEAVGWAGPHPPGRSNSSPHSVPYNRMPYSASLFSSPHPFSLLLHPPRSRPLLRSPFNICLTLKLHWAGDRNRLRALAKEPLRCLCQPLICNSYADRKQRGNERGKRHRRLEETTEREICPKNTMNRHFTFSPHCMGFTI